MKKFARSTRPAAMFEFEIEPSKPARASLAKPEIKTAAACHDASAEGTRRQA
ncbi:MAG: hypothetical protein IT560_05670 [Alphaproteobacteria bacterium]|nr:hypothetical protein [Alphaproteobacteria bacterium]